MPPMPPTPPTPRTPEQIFHDVRKIADPAERSAFLDDACKSDPVCRARVDALLAADAEAGSFLKTARKPNHDPAHDPDATITIVRADRGSNAPAEQPGQVIDRYKLLQQIGEGGFGTVWMAEQRTPVTRRVALKVIKLGMDTRQVIARFEAERQALALMDHPNIARVFDAGATETGRPYFVMEYVVGDPITDFADAHKLSVSDRLELFNQACTAVQHAHTKGIIHRDIKPSNILVNMTDGKPFAKVIDFGIAKATASPLTEKTLFTEHHQLIGTLEYMSPEQAEGLPDIDTRTDVYALGVLLYELLTGLTPFDGKRLRSAAFDEMRRIIKDEDPPMPSQRISRSLADLASTAATRRVEPTRLGTLLKGELDWIVMKSLEKDRARRYETPNQLADDLQRHLAGDAVVAAPPSAGYRLRKFVRRNKAASTVGAALLLGIAGTTTGLLIAQHNAQVALNNAGIAKAAQQNLQSQVNAATEALGRVLAAASPELGATDVKLLDDGTIQFIDSDGNTHYDTIHGPRVGTEPSDSLGKQAPIAWLSGLAMDAIHESQLADEQLRDTLRFTETHVGDFLAKLGWLDNAGGMVQTEYPEGPVGFRWNKAAGDDGQGVEFLPLDGQSETQLTKGLVDYLSTYAFEQYDALRAQTDAAEWSAYTANLALAQFAMDAGNYPESRRRLADCSKSKRGWEWDWLSSQAHEISAQFVGDARLNPEGTMVLVTNGNSAQLWGLDGVPVGRTLVTEERIYRSQFSTDGKAFVVSTPSAVHVMGTDGLPLGHPIRPAAEVRKVAIDEHGRLVAINTEDGSVGFWSAAGTPVGNPIQHPAEVESLQFIADSTLLTTASDHTARLWASNGTSIGETMHHESDINAAGMSPDHRFIVTASDDGSARLWGRSGKPVGVPMQHEGSVNSFTYSQDGDRILTESTDDVVRMWNADGTSFAGPFDNHRGVFWYGMVSARLSPDATRLLTWLGMDKIGLWDVDSRRLIATLRHDMVVSLVDFTTDGDRFITVTNPYNSALLTGLLRYQVWDSSGNRTQDALAPKLGVPVWLRQCANPRFYMLGLASESDTVTQLRDIDAGWATRIVAPGPHAKAKLTTELTQFGGTARADSPPTPYDSAVPEELQAARCLRWCPGHNRLVTGGEDGVIRFWNSITWGELASVQMPSGIDELDFTPDGTRLIVQLTDGSARIFDTRSADAQSADVQLEWAERPLAAAYLDSLFSSPTPTDALHDAIVGDDSLTPLRRLVAAEVLEERLGDIEDRADRAFEALVEGQTDTAAVLAAAAEADLPPRVKEQVLAKAEAWEYEPPRVSDKE